MADQGTYGFEADDAARIGDAVVWTESQPAFERRYRRGLGAAPLNRNMQWVYVMAATPNADGLYQAHWQTYDWTTRTWVCQGTVWAVHANAQALYPMRYRGDVVGVYQDGLAIFAVEGCCTPYGSGSGC